VRPFSPSRVVRGTSSNLGHPLCYFLAHAAERKEGRYANEKRERFGLTVDDYYFLSCSHDEDLASFPNVHISLYFVAGSNAAELVVEGLEDSVVDAATEIKNWVAFFKDEKNNFGGVPLD